MTKSRFPKKLRKVVKTEMCGVGMGLLTEIEKLN